MMLPSCRSLLDKQSEGGQTVQTTNQTNAGQMAKDRVNSDQVDARTQCVTHASVDEKHLHA